MNSLFETSFIPLFAINLISALVLLRAIYFRYSSNRETLFGLLMFSVGVFFVTFFLHNVDMSMGFAFGLFAVFSMLRYRTESLNIRDMTYLFLVIVMSLMTAVSQLPLIQLVIINSILCGVAALAETKFLAERVFEKLVTYENINNIRPENYSLLLQDLSTRTGLKISHVEIGDIDFLKDIAMIKVYYFNVHLVQATSVKGVIDKPNDITPSMSQHS